MSAVFFKALLTGLLFCVPIGPVNLLCIRRTLAEGRLSGFVSGLGAAAADSFFAYVAALGVSYIANFFLKEENFLQLGGGIFLCYLGVRIFSAKPVDRSKSTAPSAQGFYKAFSSAFFLTVANPVTILAYTAIFAGFNLNGGSSHFYAAFIAASGVFLGAILWWFILSSVVNLLRYKLTDRGILWFNRGSGIAIAVFGVLTLLDLLGKTMLHI
ncbi:LysE family translocator [Desulfotruncus alcoholivorax]|uniref:LysE family translocator n=1 Tax=Desulfotruncus alcoholivorax TaxID=265477 RepID=UPI00040ED0DF|nr:LysE family translocator [Desulfotruncus alcoholivorax]